MQVDPAQRGLLGLGGDPPPEAALGSIALHREALELRGRSAVPRLQAIVDPPDCDLGTALMIYWTSAPHYYLRYGSRGELAAYELAGWDLLRAIEYRVQRSDFRSRWIPFDPRCDRRTGSVRGIDRTRPPRACGERSVPRYMLQAV